MVCTRSPNCIVFDKVTFIRMESPNRVREPHVRILRSSIFFLFGGIKFEDLNIERKYINERALKDFKIFVCVALR